MNRQVSTLITTKPQSNKPFFNLSYQIFAASASPYTPIVRTHYIRVSTLYKICLFILKLVLNLEFSDVTVFYARIPFQQCVGC